MASFGGLYYPGESWDLEVEDSTLKKCLFFFDKIYAVVPEVFSVDWQDVQPYEELDPFLRDLRPPRLERESQVLDAIKTGKIQLLPSQQEASLHEIERHARIIKFMSKIAILRKEGVIELVNPRENLLDPPYWDASVPPANKFGVISSLYAKALEERLPLEKLEAHKPHILYGSILSDLKDRGFRSLAASLGNERVIVYKGQAEQNWLYVLGKASGFPEDEWQQWSSAVNYFGFAGTVSTIMWAALVVNHALLTAHRYDLVPITPSDLFWQLIQSKLRRLRSFAEGEQLKENPLNHPEYKTGFSGFSLAAFTLPNLEVMSFEDVLELRLELEDELSAFREQMTVLAERIKVEPWEPSFAREIERIAEHDIQPAVRKLQRKLESSSKEVVLRALKNLVSAPTGLSMLACVWAGLPPLLVMAVAAGLVSMETALEYHFERKRILQSNGLSLLLRLS
jgi:hypothetical protein